MNITAELNEMITTAQKGAATSNVYYGEARGMINGHKVFLTAVPVFGRKLSYRKCWMVDDKRCTAANLIATISA